VLMNDLFLKKHIRRFFEDGRVKELDDDIVQESRILIRLDERDFIHAVCTLSQIEEFVIGFLKTRGLIDHVQDLASLEITGSMISVTRSSRFQGFFPDLDVLETTGTRNIGPERFARDKGVPLSGFRVASGIILKGMENLSRMPLYTGSGGTHCAILFSQEGDPLVAAEDIGRHNAVDKVIGGGMKKNLNFSSCWLAVSGRLPSDMVMKPLLLGVPLIASVSAPTSEGVLLGERSGLTVVGFVRGGRLNCYSHPERIIPN
jgi:FdhD protein